jgi:hypothetical protein
MRLFAAKKETYAVSNCAQAVVRFSFWGVCTKDVTDSLINKITDYFYVYSGAFSMIAVNIRRMTL